MVALLANIGRTDLSLLKFITPLLMWYPKWKNFVQSMLAPTSHEVMAKELSCLWNLFDALRVSETSAFKFSGVYITPSCVMYMMDRLALLASLWKQDNLLYTTKSAIVEWLIHEKDVAPYSNSPDTTILSDGLDLITMFLRSYFEKYAVNLKAGDLRGKWIKWTNENTK
jgi:hypothetical protein